MIEAALQKVLGFGVEEFIKRAVEGGWYWIPGFSAEKILSDYDFVLEVELLKPKIWRAVAKAEKWEKPKTYWTAQSKGESITLLDAWECNMHSFVQALIEAPQETV